LTRGERKESDPPRKKALRGNKVNPPVRGIQRERGQNPPSTKRRVDLQTDEEGKENKTNSSVQLDGYI